MGLPLTKLDSYIYNGEEKSSDGNPLTPIETKELIDLENTAPSSPSDTTNEFHIASMYTEKDILKLENDSLAKIKKNLHFGQKKLELIEEPKNSRNSKW